MPLRLLLLLPLLALGHAAFVLTLAGRNYGRDAAAVAVRINGAPVDRGDVVLHNSTTLTFVLPDAFVADKSVRKSSSVVVEVAGLGVVRAVGLEDIFGRGREVAWKEFLEEEMGGGGKVKGRDEGGKEGKVESVVGGRKEGRGEKREEEGGATRGDGKGKVGDAGIPEEKDAAGDGKGEGGDRKSKGEGDGDGHEEVNMKLPPSNGIEFITDPSPSEPFDEDAVDPGPIVTAAPHRQSRKLFMDAAEEEAEELAAATRPSPEAPPLTPEQHTIRDRYDEALYLVDSDAPAGEAVTIRSHLDANIAAQHAPSMALMAGLLLAGDAPGFDRDFDAALPLVRMSSDAGDADGQALMALLYASGMAEPEVMKDTGKAVLLWTVAAAAGSNYAKMAIAFRMHTGLDIPENCESAARLYREVARDVVLESRRISRGESKEEEREKLASIKAEKPRGPGGPYGQARRQEQTADLERLVENMKFRPRGESNEIIQYYMHSANRGDGAAQVLIGKLYYYGGSNVPRDVVRARSFFDRAADGGRSDAHAHLGFMDLNEGKNASAVRHLGKAAAAGNKLGLHGMGYVTLHGIGVEKNAREAADFFTRAAEAEHPEAMYNLGLLYSSGIGVEASETQAFRYFQEAALWGHLQAHYNLGVKRLEGVASAPPSCNLAISKNLKHVAEQGPWNKALSRALRSYEKQNFGNALFRYMQAAHAGIELAQYNAAFMLEQNFVYNGQSSVVPLLGGGGGIPFLDVFTGASGGAGLKDAGRNRRKGSGGGKDWTRAACVAEALDLYHMSSSQGYSSSMVRLGDLAYGEGQDMRRATYAYERSARMRNAEGSFNLGWMHAVGLVSKPDAFLAKRYFDEAKNMDRHAHYPVALALYLLQYHEFLLNSWNRWNSFMDGTSSLLEAIDDEQSGGLGESEKTPSLLPYEMMLVLRYGDIGLVLVLVGILAWIVNARQRRLVQDDGDGDGEDGEGPMAAVGFERLGNDRAELRGHRE